MTALDATAVGIILGIAGAVLYTVSRAVRARTFDLALTVLTFLTCFALPGGVLLIVAGITGDMTRLPSTWREHVVVAGIAVLGLSGQAVIRLFRGVWKADSAEERPEPASEA